MVTPAGMPLIVKVFDTLAVDGPEVIAPLVFVHTLSSRKSATDAVLFAMRSHLTGTVRFS